MFKLCQNHGVAKRIAATLPRAFAMKSVSFVLGIFAAAAIMPAAAQNYPWCAQYGGTAGGVMNCGFVSFDQCMATLSGMGGFCNQNTQYQAAKPATSKRIRKNLQTHF